MGFIDLVKQRSSIRKYKSNSIPAEKIRKVLEAARLAPSWGNAYCSKFLVVKNLETKNELAEASGCAWLSTAPVVIVALADPKSSGKRDGKSYYLVDVGISMDHLILAATELGLGTCWIGGFNEKKARKALRVPKKLKIVAMTPIGYPDESPRSKVRKPLEEIVSIGQYGN
jgi:nitroreductase